MSINFNIALEVEGNLPQDLIRYFRIEKAANSL